MKKIINVTVNLLSVSLIILLCYLVFFHHLGEYPLRLFDEARNGVNALEMLKTSNPLITTFKGSPDLWNVKPPLFIWISTLMFKIFGISEYSLRFTSALSATLVTIIIYLFGSIFLKKPFAGLFGALIILSSMGFPDTHIGRTGDYDALLILWVFLGVITFYIHTITEKNKYLYLSALFWILSVYTKSVAGLFMVPGIYVFLFLTGQIKKIVNNRHFWFLLIFGIATIAGYYILREHFGPGYLNFVRKEETFGRYGDISNFSRNDFWFYFNYLSDFRFQKWVWITPFTILAYFLTKDKRIKNWVLLSYILTISYFLIISFSKTKNLWYDAQLYPFASLLVSILLIELIRRVPLILRVLPILILCFYLQRYIRTNLAFINRPDLEKSNSCIKYGYLFRDKEIVKNGFIGVHKEEEYCMPMQFYFEREGLNTKKIGSITNGDKILTCDYPTLKLIEESFKTKRLFESKENCYGIEVLNKHK
jgi:4-amino-4-deoxy-L-arabinose transferase-like glycosyltransferase